MSLDPSRAIGPDSDEVGVVDFTFSSSPLSSDKIWVSKALFMYVGRWFVGFIRCQYLVTVNLCWLASLTSDTRLGR
jgi:hypothetical protein